MASLAVSHPSVEGVRPVQLPRDAVQLINLLNLVFSPLDTEPRPTLNSLIQTPTFLQKFSLWRPKVENGFVWVEAGQIIGNSSIIPTNTPGRAIIANVAVAPTHRRQGIARQLLHASLEHLANHHFKVVVLQVDVNNPNAIHLYESLGFRPMGSMGYWLAAPDQWRELSSNVAYEKWPVRYDSQIATPEIRPMQGRDYHDAYAVDLDSQPIDLNWPELITPHTYRQSWRELLNAFLNSFQFEAWGVYNGDGKLIAFGGIASEWGRGHRLIMRVPAQHQSLTRPIFAKLLRRLRYLRRNYVTIDHRADDTTTNQLLQAANFSSKRQLITMKLELATDVG